MVHIFAAQKDRVPEKTIVRRGDQIKKGADKISKRLA